MSLKVADVQASIDSDLSEPELPELWIILVGVETNW
jgi:hypothetical protein